jgi:hypothetical protein
MMFCWFINVYEKQSSKVQKVVTLISISTFFSSTTYKKSNEQNVFIDDLVLVVMKGLLLLNIIETYGWSDLNNKGTHD